MPIDNDRVSLYYFFEASETRLCCRVPVFTDKCDPISLTMKSRYVHLSGFDYEKRRER